MFLEFFAKPAATSRLTRHFTRPFTSPFMHASRLFPLWHTSSTHAAHAELVGTPDARDHAQQHAELAPNISRFDDPFAHVHSIKTSQRTSSAKSDPYLSDFAYVASNHATDFDADDSLAGMLLSNHESPRLNTKPLDSYSFERTQSRLLPVSSPLPVSTPLSRGQTITRILEINASASSDYLLRFDDAQLREYLDHVDTALDTRRRSIGWQRRETIPAVAMRDSN